MNALREYLKFAAAIPELQDTVHGLTTVLDKKDQQASKSEAMSNDANDQDKAKDEITQFFKNIMPDVEKKSKGEAKSVFGKVQKRKPSMFDALAEKRKRITW